MTIQLNMNSTTLIEDLKVLNQVFQCTSVEHAESLGKYIHIQNISFQPYTENNIVINVSMKEFALIGVFNKGLQ